MLIILISLFGKWLKIRIFYMSCNGIWRPKETIDGFKFIGANGFLRETFQWKCIVFKMGVVAESFLEKGMTIFMCDCVTVKMESVKFSSMIIKSHIS